MTDRATFARINARDGARRRAFVEIRAIGAMFSRAFAWLTRAVTGRKRARDDAEGRATNPGSGRNQRRRLNDADGADVGRFVAQIPVGSFRIGASATLDDDDAMEEDDATVEDEHAVVLDHLTASVDEQEAQARAEDEPRVHAANWSFRIGASATLDDDDAMEEDDTTVEDEHEVVLDHVLASVDEQEASRGASERDASRNVARSERAHP